MSEKNLRASGNGNRQNRWLFPVLFVAVIALLMFLFNLVSGGAFLEMSNLRVILSHIVYPSFIAWGFCFLFACGYTDMSIGGVIVLGSFASCILGNKLGIPGVVIGGLVVGMLLIFINFLIFTYTKIPSWIAGISLAMIYEAIAVFLKMGSGTKALVTASLEKPYRVLGQLPWSLVFLAVGWWLSISCTTGPPSG
jgi:ribose transport system permease protein